MKAEPHHQAFLKGIPWAMCRYCGLLYLHNYASEWAVRKGCNYSEDPAWPKILKTSAQIAQEKWVTKHGC